MLDEIAAYSNLSVGVQLLLMYWDPDTCKRLQSLVT